MPPVDGESPATTTLTQVILSLISHFNHQLQNLEAENHQYRARLQAVQHEYDGLLRQQYNPQTLGPQPSAAKDEDWWAPQTVPWMSNFGSATEASPSNVIDYALPGGLQCAASTPADLSTPSEGTTNRSPHAAAACRPSDTVHGGAHPSADVATSAPDIGSSYMQHTPNAEQQYRDQVLNMMGRYVSDETATSENHQQSDGSATEGQDAANVDAEGAGFFSDSDSSCTLDYENFEQDADFDMQTQPEWSELQFEMEQA